MRLLLAGVLFVLSLAPAASARPSSAVDAGSLVVRVAADPWQLTFTDARGTTVLREAPERDAGPIGALGFRTAAGWMRATRVVASRAARRELTLTVATTDPDGRTLEVVLVPDGEGVVALTARVLGDRAGIDALGIGFEASTDERFLGFGERNDAIDQRGRVVESWVADGPFQEIELPFVQQLVPPPGFRPRDDATYYPVPWMLSTRGYGVLVDNDEPSYFRAGSERPDRLGVEVVGAPVGMPALPLPEMLRLRVFAGPTPAEALRRFTVRTGRQPAVDAPWVLGPWFQPGGSVAEQEAQVGKLRAADAPVSVAQTYTHYLPCGDHVRNRAGERDRLHRLHALGLAVTTYFNPMICESYQPAFARAVAAGALATRADGSPYIYDYAGSQIFRVGQFDFTRQAGRAEYGRLLHEAISDGHDGWMEDFGEYTPPDGFQATGPILGGGHNRYATEYHCGAYATVRRVRRPVVRFQRSGWTGAAPCAQVVWSGDPTTGWGFDGLASVVTGGLNMGMSGIAIWGSDIGGYFALGDNALTPELLIRWVQVGAVSGVMRTQRNGTAVPPKVRPQIYDDAQIPNWKRYAKLRTQLYPYTAAAAAEYRRSGLPLMRHLALVHPDDAEAVAQDDAFLFGPDLLVAPVLAPGRTTREAYLPAGGWIDLWRAGTWDSAAGVFVLGAADVLPGGRRVTVPAPLEELPLFVRAGALLPLVPADVDTLADYGDPAPGFVRLRDRRDRMALLAFPRGASEARMVERVERLRSLERADGWELAVRGRRRRTYALQASLATLERPFAPCAVEWNGTRLPESAWSFDAATRVLRAEFRGVRGRLVVRVGCGR
ncbi:MAG: glycoside hydrolase family 31 protein [bacterium]|nr:glycoside hydrolase family 31 protein [bacterium]